MASSDPSKRITPYKTKYCEQAATLRQIKATGWPLDFCRSGPKWPPVELFMAAQALGLIEMRGLVGVTEAADAAVKAASVSLSGLEKIEGGLVSIRVLGDVGAVQAAVEAGALAGGQVGELIAKHIIPNPHDDLIDAFCLENRNLNGADLESYSVTQLRRLARETEGLAIQGREISHANREQLIQELQKTQETESRESGPV